MEKGKQVNTIELNGLTETQCMIADFLWAVETDEDMEAVEETFGTDAEIVKQLMLAAMFDEVEDLSQANEFLSTLTLQ